jgi:hypothetical protein
MPALRLTCLFELLSYANDTRIDGPPLRMQADYHFRLESLLRLLLCRGSQDVCHIALCARLEALRFRLACLFCLQARVLSANNNSPVFPQCLVSANIARASQPRLHITSNASGR